MGRLHRFLSGVVDYTLPVVGGLAAHVYAACGQRALVVWLREANEEPEIIA